MILWKRGVRGPSEEPFAREPDPAAVVELAMARSDILALAHPRMSGSRDASKVEVELRRRFRDEGYRILELNFSFSTWPGRFGVCVAGALLAATLSGSAAGLAAGRPGPSLLTLAVGAALLLGLAAAARHAIDRLPWGRVHTSNWLVSRAGAEPRFLVMAHRDSKSQPFSLLVRAASVVAAALSASALAATSGLAWAGFVEPRAGWILAAAAPGTAAAAVLLTGFAGNRSPGALDNASGLAALLALARREKGHDDVAFLVTDGEELGLAGAQAAAWQLYMPVDAIINLDGLDDDGEFHVVDRHGFPRRGTAPDLAAAILEAARGLDLPATRRRLPPGVLVDHIVLADAGFPAVTVMRGGFDSLRRVHRPHDDSTRITGAGVAATAALVAGALRILRSSGES